MSASESESLDATSCEKQLFFSKLGLESDLWMTVPAAKQGRSNRLETPSGEKFVPEAPCRLVHTNTREESISRYSAVMRLAFAHAGDRLGPGTTSHR